MNNREAMQKEFEEKFPSFANRLKVGNQSALQDDEAIEAYVVFEVGFNAALASQAQQEPVKAVPIGFDYLDNGQLVATYAVPVIDKGHPKLYTTPQTQQTESQWIIPTESQILAATEKAGLWPNTVYTWLPAFHRYHAELAKLPPAPEGGE